MRDIVDNNILKEELFGVDTMGMIYQCVINDYKINLRINRQSWWRQEAITVTAWHIPTEMRYGSRSILWYCGMRTAIRILWDVMTYIPVYKFYDSMGSGNVSFTPVFYTEPLDIVLEKGTIL